MSAQISTSRKKEVRTIRPNVVVIDGNNMAHRAFHAMGDLYAADGRPTGILYGVLNGVFTMADRFDPDHVVVAWDGSMKSWRYGIFKPYKSGRKERYAQERPEMTEMRKTILSIQIPDCVKALDGFGVTQVRLDTLEADDIMAVLAEPHLRKDDNARYILVSTDKDLIQCVRYANGYHAVDVYNPQTERMYRQNSKGYVVSLSVEGNTERLAPNPQTYLLRRAVVGDSSDSIDGVPGVGEKTVTDNLIYPWDYCAPIIEYLSRCGTPGKRGQAMINNVEIIMRNVRIMKLGSSVELEQGITKADRNYIQSCRRNAPVPEGIPPFLEGVLSAPRKYAHPNWIKLHDIDHPMIRFFARRGISWAFDLQQWAAVQKKMARLYSLKVKLAEAGGIYGTT